MTEISPSERILCALDTTDTDQAMRLAQTIKNHVGGVKLGFEFFYANGVEGYKAVAECNMPIFLDLKLHDIPNTVAKAIHSLMPLKPAILTIHTSGGPAMMRAAVQAAREAAEQVGCARPLIVGVTILTSLDDPDLEAIGMHAPVSDQAVRLARLAKDCGLDGVVCSSHEITAIKEACGREFKLVVPGIRPKGSQSEDQKRIMTPEQAVSLGADYLVIGRPITKAADPAAAAINIANELNG